jgi:hypothetical protein
MGWLGGCENGERFFGGSSPRDEIPAGCLRHKYKQGRSGIGMPELRRRFCVPGTWRFAYNGVAFTGASSVPVTRYP